MDPSRRPPLVDVALTAGLLTWAAIEALTAYGPGTAGQRILFAVAVTVPLLWRRVAPLTVVAALIAVLMVRILLLPGLEDSTFPFPSLLVATFSVARYTRNRWAAAGAGLATVAAMLSMFPLGYYGLPVSIGQLLILAFFVSGAWGAGWLVRRRTEAVRDTEEAVRAERERIAREIHDVVAHSLSIVAVQAGAAEALLGAAPDAAREHIAAARRTAREALAEMRHVLDVTGAHGGLTPQPTLERVAELVDGARGAGLPVTLRVRGARGEVPAGVDLAAYRIVQEALTNARRHSAGGPATVRIHYDDEGIDIEVSNAMPAGVAVRGAGRGLVGMRERARVYGGHVTAAPDGDRFTVRARLPRTAP